MPLNEGRIAQMQCLPERDCYMILDYRHVELPAVEFLVRKEGLSKDAQLTQGIMFPSASNMVVVC